MTEKKKHFVSLSVKPLFVLLLGLVLGVCVCLLANFTGEQIIERSYMSDKAVLKRTNRAAQEFQSFVRQNSISTRDTDMLASWGESRKNYYIMLYHDQRQILEIGWWGADSAAVDAYSLKEQMASVVYPIVFRDGTFYAVIYDNSDSGLYDLLWIVSLLLGCAVLALTQEYGLSARLTFSNSLLTEAHLSDPACNALCRLFSEPGGPQNGVIVHSDLLLDYLRTAYPRFYFVSSTTKVLTGFPQLRKELEREAFRFVVPDFRLNRAFEQLRTLPQSLKDKTEFLCNECCWFGCKDRKACYEAVSRKTLGEDAPHRCTAPGAADGYRFSRAMENLGFISAQDIRTVYLPMGFTNFKLEGRGLGSAILLEFLLYYLTKPEHQLHVREAIYLDAMLDLF